MPTTINRSQLQKIISVSGMARLVNLSRPQFYFHMKRGVFLPPVYCIVSKRPLYTRSMQKRNVEVRQQQVGINGEYVLFYDRQGEARQTTSQRRTRPTKMPRVPHAQLIERLRGLGLTNVTSGQVEVSVRECFPEGINSTDESVILRQVFRHLRRSNVE